jgi:SAM-dependent methyltransferase
MQNEWDKLATAYETAQVEGDSLDTLVEYPAQREAMGSIQGLRILDIACGSGRKALDWALNGATEVYAFDISRIFVEPWAHKDKPRNLKVFIGDLANLDGILELQGERFDLVTAYQAVGYPQDLQSVYTSIRRLLRSGGRFIFSTAHPFRYVVERMDAQHLSPAEAYRSEGGYSYPSTWDPSISVTHTTPMISSRVNALLRSGFALERILEPNLTPEQKAKYPHKKQWMDKYFGIIIYVARAT